MWFLFSTGFPFFTHPIIACVYFQKRDAIYRQTPQVLILANCQVNMDQLPVEILELIFGYLSSVVDQVNVCLVCRRWRLIVLELRSFVRVSHKRNWPTLDKHVYTRLPVAGSLQEGHSEEGFALMLNLTIQQPIFFCGASIFLPHPESLKGRKVTDKLSIVTRLHNHATWRVGPIGISFYLKFTATILKCPLTGSLLASEELELSIKEIKEFAAKCPKQAKNSLPEQTCLQGPWMTFQVKVRWKSCDTTCNSIHPYPVTLKKSVILWPNVKYLLAVDFKWNKGCDFSEAIVDTISGFQGFPRIEPNNDHPQLFQWTEVYRSGFNTSSTSGQFPHIFYIK